jgi:hypothetical protein
MEIKPYIYSCLVSKTHHLESIKTHRLELTYYIIKMNVNRLFSWLLRVARLYKLGRQEPGSRDTTDLLAPAEPGPGCFKYRASMTLYLHAGNQTHTSHA